MLNIFQIKTKSLEQHYKSHALYLSNIVSMLTTPLKWNSAYVFILIGDKRILLLRPNLKINTFCSMLKSCNHIVKLANNIKCLWVWYISFSGACGIETISKYSEWHNHRYLCHIYIQETKEEFLFYFTIALKMWDTLSASLKNSPAFTCCSSCMSMQAFQRGSTIPAM